MQLTAVYVREGKWIVAWLAELPAVMTQGATIEEARENLHDAFQLMMEVQREDTERQLQGHMVESREPFFLSA